MIPDEIHYCPYCHWNLYSAFFPGNNGLVRKYYCSFCGLMVGESVWKCHSPIQTDFHRVLRGLECCQHWCFWQCWYWLYAPGGFHYDPHPIRRQHRWQRRSENAAKCLTSRCRFNNPKHCTYATINILQINWLVCGCHTSENINLWKTHPNRNWQFAIWSNIRICDIQRNDRPHGRVKWLHTVTREPMKGPSPITAFILRSHPHTSSTEECEQEEPWLTYQNATAGTALTYGNLRAHIMLGLKRATTVSRQTRILNLLLLLVAYHIREHGKCWWRKS